MTYLKRVSSIEDFEPYYLLKCQTDAVLWSGFEKEPNREVLYNHYVERIISSDKILIYYLYDDEYPNEVIGYGQLTIVDGEIEFSATNIFKKFQGCMYLQDLSTFILEEAKSLGYQYIIGWASEKNKPAVLNLRINHFTKTDIFEEREMKAMGEFHRFYKWIKELK